VKAGCETLACRSAPGQRCIVSRMTTRTKIGVCAGLLAVAVGGMVGLRSPAKPEVEAKFVRYAQDGGVVVAFANRGPAVVNIGSGKWWRPDSDSRTITNLPDFEYNLAPGEEARLVTTPFSTQRIPEDRRLSMRCWLVHSPLRYRIQNLLRKVGVRIIDSSDFVMVSVTLPPRETNTPAQPVTP
jgi:hypothetical protein